MHMHIVVIVEAVASCHVRGRRRARERGRSKLKLCGNDQAGRPRTAPTAPLTDQRRRLVVASNKSYLSDPISGSYSILSDSDSDCLSSVCLSVYGFSIVSYVSEVDKQLALSEWSIHERRCAAPALFFFST